MAIVREAEAKNAAERAARRADIGIAPSCPMLLFAQVIAGDRPRVLF
jgi:hypothetical protein